MVNVGCNTLSNKTPEVTSEQSEDLNSITSNDIEALEFDDYGLSTDGEKALENWQKYHELIEQMDYIYKTDFSFFNGDMAVLKTFMNDLKTEMPEDIKTASILARINAMETMLLNLNSLFKLDHVDKSIRLNAIKDVLVSKSNLNLQINKKFELDANLVDKDSTNE